MEGDEPDWIIRVRFRKSKVPAVQRIRRLLKIADELGLRAVVLRYPTPAEAAAVPVPGSDPPAAAVTPKETTP